ncbi:MAG TPA: peptide ABC transporter substrate-binding protein [Myxococcota bacterium]|nr:peptide ABC transporter substrate-binding protein [Myxococcota bacterium]
MDRALVGVLLAAALLVAGVARLVSLSSLPPADFTFVNGTEPRTLDPGLMTGEPEGRIGDALFEGLTRRNARSLRPEPAVAERWETSADGLRFTFHLRADARWSDGRAVSAQDFAAAWRRLEDPRTGSEYAYLLHVLRDAEAFHAYGAAADALEGPIARGLDALVAAHPEGVDAREWQRFLASEGVAAALAGAREPAIVSALSRYDARVTAEELHALRGELLSEAARRRAEHEAAAERFGRTSGVFATDERTLVVELAAPTPYFLELTSFYPTFPVPPGAFGSQDWFLPEKIVSNGPFRLELWRVNDRIRLVRSDTYWDRASVRLATVDALPIENATTALNLYLTGAVDWLPSAYPVDLAPRLSGRSDFYSSPGLAVYYYRINTRRPPLDDPRVREALSLAVDRQAICSHVLGLGQLPATTFVPPGIPGYDPPPSALGYDVPRARRLLAEAGFPEGRGFPELGILYNTHEGHKKIAEVVADSLRRNLGISVKPYNQEWQAYQASTLAGDYDLARAAWVGDYVDPNTFLDLWVTNGGNNQTGWGDPTYDALIRAAADVARFAREDRGLALRVGEPARLRADLDALDAARDPEGRARVEAALRLDLLREAEAILVQRGFPVLPVYFYVTSGLVSPRVRGFYVELEQEDGTRTPNLQQLHPLRAIWLEPPTGKGAG